ncbi:MAG: DUF2007 domain-containing protein [Parvibaculaceae bacterium]
MKLVVLTATFNRPESEAVVSFLASEGIEAVVGERHHAAIHGDWLVALQGIRILVPEHEASRARHLLAAAAEPVELWESHGFRRQSLTNTVALLCLFFGFGFVYCPYWIRTPPSGSAVESAR